MSTMNVSCWFITAIAVEDDSPQSRDSRCFGFYAEYADAMSAVMQNRCDMRECLYDYLVMEEIGEGIHPEVKKEIWFKWMEERRGWYHCVKPSEFVGVVNWALG